MNVFSPPRRQALAGVATAAKGDAYLPSELAALPVSELWPRFRSGPSGLSEAEARARLGQVGRNELASERRRSWWQHLLKNLGDPLVVLLIVLATVSFLTGDLKATVLIALMVCLSVTMRSVQEYKADAAAERLKAMVHTQATVVRGGATRDVPLATLVPGDILHLSAGDLVPADVRLLASKDLFINQAALTGESLPAEKHAPPSRVFTGSDFELANMCYMGTGVSTGTAVALVVATGRRTKFGALAEQVVRREEVSSFDRGVNRFTWLMIRLIAIMVPLVFIINGFARGDWFEAFFFAVAIGVGLTPELLPMVVTVNLSRGATDMARRKVIVKRLNSIQNFGAMDVLCTDKTGTLTKGKVELIKHVGLKGEERADVLQYAFLNSHYQTGLKNLLDEAVLEYRDIELPPVQDYRKVDEVPFDFTRRRMSVVVEHKGRHLLICKGAVEEVMSRCRRVVYGEDTIPLVQAHHDHKDELVRTLGEQGFRVIALALGELAPTKQTYSAADETELTLVGFLAFLDPPKTTAAETIRLLEADGVRVVVLTGDNELVSRQVCGQVGIPAERVVLGQELNAMSEEALGQLAERACVFAKLEPVHKERIIRALRAHGHVVGYLGDGINDAPALKAADVGISVDSATDIARETSDIILLEKSLRVLRDGVRAGRRVFGNIVKYIRMASSSNFGNMASVLGASAFLPFLPMLPIQVLANNLLYDVSQVTIPSDKVDAEYLVRPRRWEIKNLEHYIFTLGPISSLFDYITFAVIIFFFGGLGNPELFRTCWFVESLLSQTLIIHFIRTPKVPFVVSRASRSLTLSTVGITLVGVGLPFTPLARVLGLVAPPAAFWAALALVLAGYFAVAYFVNRWFNRRFSA